MNLITYVSIKRVRFTNFWENMDIYHNILISILFTLLISIGAKMRMYTSLSPVPFTFQTLFVLTAGLYLKERWSLLSTGSYLLLGMIGIPVFTGSTSGISYFIGPTAGYLLAFLFASLIVSKIFRRYRRTWLSGLFSSFLGCLVILGIGSVYLGIYLHNLVLGFFYGFIPFIGWEIVKSSLATVFAKVLISKAILKS